MNIMNTKKLKFVITAHHIGEPCRISFICFLIIGSRNVTLTWSKQRVQLRPINRKVISHYTDRRVECMASVCNSNCQLLV